MIQLKASTNIKNGFETFNTYLTMSHKMVETLTALSLQAFGLGCYRFDKLLLLLPYFSHSC